MKKEEFNYLSSDGKTMIHAVKWIPSGEVKMVLQISHGVTEHILRYEKFANYFSLRGILVVGNDHLGHGSSIIPNAQPMYFGSVGSWNKVVEDIEKCREIISSQYSGIPYCLLGFSLGSFAVRTHLIDYPGRVDMCILIGTGQTPNLSIKLAKFMANKEAKKYGEQFSSPVIRQLTFGTYNKMFAPNRTEFDWLCSNEESIDEYINDPLRGDSMSSGLFREMLTGMEYTAKLENMKKMDRTMPILLLSGSKDPVGDCGKGVIKTVKSLKKAEIQDITFKIYPDLRHDILNEKDNKEIYEDIYKWLNEKNVL